MERITGCFTAVEYQQLDRQLQRKYVREMYAEKLSMSQIARLTGMPKTTVHRAIRDSSGISEPLETEEALLLHEEDLSAYDPSLQEIW